MKTCVLIWLPSLKTIAGTHRVPVRAADNYHITPFTIWDFVRASLNCPYEMERIDRLGDGGNYVCGLSRYEQTSKPCIVYSFGIQQESSLEEELLERTKCELWGYDPSVDEFGPQLKTKMKGRAHVTKAGISGKTDKTANPPYYTIVSRTSWRRMDISTLISSGWTSRVTNVSPLTPLTPCWQHLTRERFQSVKA